MELYENYTEDTEMTSFSDELNCLKYKKKDLNVVTCYFFYVNAERSLLAVNKEDIKLSIPNTVLKSEVINLVKINSKYHANSYKLTYLLKYNFNIDEKDVKNMENYCLLESIDSLDDISFHPSVEVIRDINSLFFVFFEKELEHRSTRKVNAPKVNAPKLNSITRKK